MSSSPPYQVKATPFFRRLGNAWKRTGEHQRLREEFERMQINNFDFMTPNLYHHQQHQHQCAPTDEMFCGAFQNPNDMMDVSMDVGYPFNNDAPNYDAPKN